MSRSNYQPPAPSTPRFGHAARKGYSEQRRKWTPRCPTCEGRGWIQSLKGEVQDCPRCCEDLE